MKSYDVGVFYILVSDRKVAEHDEHMEVTGDRTAGIAHPALFLGTLLEEPIRSTWRLKP